MRWSAPIPACLALALVLSPACARQADDVGDEDTGSESDSGTDTQSETETGETGAEVAECEGAEICNPLGDECPEGELCIFFNTEFQCFPSTGDGTGVAGAACDTATFCNEGLACIQSVFFTSCDGDACCAPHCDLSLAEDPCPAGQVCDPWFEGQMDIDACYMNSGVCITQP